MAIRSTGADARPSPFDALFAELAGDLPVALLRALAQHESSFQPAEINPKGAYGLFQITQGALDGYNARHETSYTPTDILTPELNTEIAVDHIHRILARYAEHPALKTDWADRRFVELLIFGWNVGHNGVAGIVGKLEAAGLPPARITIDTVSQLAAQVSHNANLSSVKHVAYARAVARTYFGDDVIDAGPRLASISGVVTFLLGLGVLGLTIAVAPRGR